MKPASDIVAGDLIFGGTVTANIPVLVRNNPADLKTVVMRNIYFVVANDPVPYCMTFAPGDMVKIGD